MTTAVHADEDASHSSVAPAPAPPARAQDIDPWTPVPVAQFNEVLERFFQDASSLSIDALLVRREDNRNTLLHAVAGRTDGLALVRALLEAGIPPSPATTAGWTPLHEAVQHNRLETCKLLVAHGASPTVYSKEITPLLLASRLGNVEITRWLLAQASMWDGAWSELLLKQLLASTPLVVSDYLDRFAVVLNHDETKIQFSYLKCMYGAPETPVDATLLALLSRHQHARRLVSHRAVQYIIKTKWRAFGASRFLREFAVFLVLLLSFYIPTVAAEYRALNVDSPIDIILTASRAIAVACALFLLLSVELAECIGATPRKYLSSFWNWVNLISYVGVLVSAVVDAIVALAPARNGVIAVLHVSLWINLLQFLQVSSSSGLLVAMMRHMIKDVYKFLLLYAVFLFGYSGAFYVLLRGSAGYDSFINAFITVFLMLFGTLDYSVFSDKNESLSTWSWLVANALLLSHLVAVVVMLLNILIAMMTTTFEDVWDAAEAEALLIRARAIVRIEKSLTHEEREATWRSLLSSADLRDWEATVVGKTAGQQEAAYSKMMRRLRSVVSNVGTSLRRVGASVAHVSCRLFRRQRKSKLRRVMDLFAAKRMAPLEDGVRFEESLARSTRTNDLSVETNDTVKQLQAQVAELTRLMVDMQRQLRPQE